MADTSRKLRRYPKEGWLGGVCAGIAYAFGFPVWPIRLLWFMAVAFYGFGILAYLLLWLFVPAYAVPEDFDSVTGD